MVEMSEMYIPPEEVYFGRIETFFLFRERTCYIKGLLMCSSWLTLFQQTYIQNILSRVRQL